MKIGKGVRWGEGASTPDNAAQSIFASLMHPMKDALSVSQVLLLHVSLKSAHLLLLIIIYTILFALELVRSAELFSH